MSSPAPEHADAPPDPAVRRAEERLVMLRELAEIGMALARALRPGAAADPASETSATGKGRDPADAFAGLSRAIRLTFALEAKTDEALRDLKAGIVRERHEKKAQATEQAATSKSWADREDRVRDVVMTIAEAEIGDVEVFEDLCAALEERLDQDGSYWICGGRPVRESVKRLCKDLALTPDWSRWEAEGWLDDDAPIHHAPFRSRFSPFNPPSARPLFPEDRPPAPLPPQPPQPAHHLE